MAMLVGAAAALRAPAPSMPKEAPLLEQRAFEIAHKGNEVKCARALRAKLDWVETNGGRCGTNIAPFLRSEGFVVAVEGCTDYDGNPLIYSRGVPHGSSSIEVARQVAYAYDRCLAQCEAADRPQPSATTIVDVRAPSFRFPDFALIGAITMLPKYYPWVASCSIVFLSCPMPVQWCFKRLKAFMTQAQYDSIIFAEREELSAYVPPSSLPPELGGDADWSIDRYIASRCAAEGVADTGEVRPYTGPVVDWGPLDKFDEERRQRRQRARTPDEPGAPGAPGATDAANTEVAAAAMEMQQQQQQLELEVDDEESRVVGTVVPSWRARLRRPFRRRQGAK